MVRGIAAGPYHAGMENEDRERVHRAWLDGTTQIVCATMAFGLGINKLAVRFVIHFSMPPSLEAFYQESGRAARDGQLARSILLFKPADVTRQSTRGWDSQGSRAVEQCYEMAAWADDVERCRRVRIASHFGEAPPPCAGAAACDVCRAKRGARDGAAACARVDASELLLSIAAILSGTPRSRSTAAASAASKAKRYTLLQLVDAARKARPRAWTKAWPKRLVARAILAAIRDGVLIEEFAHTAYSTNSYVAVGATMGLVKDGTVTVTVAVRSCTSSAPGNRAGASPPPTAGTTRPSTKRKRAPRGQACAKKSEQAYAKKSVVKANAQANATSEGGAFDLALSLDSSSDDDFE